MRNRESKEKSDHDVIPFSGKVKVKQNNPRTALKQLAHQSSAAHHSTITITIRTTNKRTKL